MSSTLTAIDWNKTTEHAKNVAEYVVGAGLSWRYYRLLCPSVSKVRESLDTLQRENLNRAVAAMASDATEKEKSESSHRFKKIQEEVSKNAREAYVKKPEALLRACAKFEEAAVEGQKDLITQCKNVDTHINNYRVFLNFERHTSQIRRSLQCSPGARWASIFVGAYCVYQGIKMGTEAIIHNEIKDEENIQP